MAALPYMQLYVADYLADTAHLNAAQHGAYLLLLMNYWQRGKALKNDNERLANVARMSNDEWNKNRDVLEEFFEVTDFEWVHIRVERDLAAVLSKSAKASAAGKASAERRGNIRSTPVQQTFNHTDTDTDINPIVDADASTGANNDGNKPAKAPVNDLLALYNQELGNILPRALSMNDSRKRALAVRWKEMLGSLDQNENPRYTDKETGLAWWARFFRKVKINPHWLGENDRGWRADLDWIIKSVNFTKILEYRKPKG